MNLRVLVVDDEPLIAHNLQAFLEDEGMQVKSVGSVEEALALNRAVEAVYDVCVMDLRLPGMDGNAGIRALHELFPTLRFIIHTGSTNYAIPEDLRAMGIDETRVFMKPLVDMGPLADTVRALARD